MKLWCLFFVLCLVFHVTLFNDVWGGMDCLGRFFDLTRDVAVRGVHSINAFIFGWNILWNYAMAITNQAGGVKIVSVSKPGVPVTAKDGLWGAGDQASLPPGFGWCRHCNGPKPPRAHHCSVCGTCVLKMDHHCPWMANCVGQRNHRYFVLFLIWLMIGCIYLAGTASLMLKYNDAVTIPRSVRQSTTFCMVLASSAGLSVGILGIWHVYLAATAQTTIDFQTNRMAKERATLKGEVWSNPYDLGYINNWNRFFNVSTPLMAFWPSLTPLDDDGVSWMTREDLARRTMAKHTPSYIA